jgi:hypothetical protein
MNKRLSRVNQIVLLLFLLMLCGCTINYEKDSSIASADWKSKLKSSLPAFGHRNWIIVADAAYPKQSAAGIETIVTNSDQTEVLKYVLDEIDSTQHVYALVLLDAELKFVSEEDALGIDTYRIELQSLLKDKDVSYLPHEEIISKLDQAAKLFNILILKTDMTIPYTSVFFELGCGYWDADKEAELRQAIEKSIINK